MGIVGISIVEGMSSDGLSPSTPFFEAPVHQKKKVQRQGKKCDAI